MARESGGVRGRGSAGGTKRDPQQPAAKRRVPIADGGDPTVSLASRFIRKRQKARFRHSLFLKIFLINQRC